MTLSERQILRAFHRFVVRLDDEGPVDRGVREHAHQMRQELEATWPWLQDERGTPP